MHQLCKIETNNLIEDIVETQLIIMNVISLTVSSL